MGRIPHMRSVQIILDLVASVLVLEYQQILLLAVHVLFIGSGEQPLKHTFPRQMGGPTRSGHYSLLYLPWFANPYHTLQEMLTAWNTFDLLFAKRSLFTTRCDTGSGGRFLNQPPHVPNTPR